MDQKNNGSYADLQKGIDLLIRKFGVSKAAIIVKQITGTTTLKRNEKQKVQLLVTFIVSESRRLYDCNGLKIDQESSKEFKESRMAAYHLTKKYTAMSYQQLGKPFDQSKRAVIHHYNKCKDLLSTPQFNKDFVARYKILEENILQFITKIY